MSFGLEVLEGPPPGEIPLGVLAFQQPPVLEEDLDRDCVGSLKHGPRTHPAHAEGRLVYNGADRDGKNGNPSSRMPGGNGSIPAPRSGCPPTIFRVMRLARRYPTACTTWHGMRRG